MRDRALFIASLIAALLLAAGASAQSTRIAPPTGPIFDGTKTCGSAAATIVSASTSAVSVIVRNADAAESIKIGDATPALTLPPGASVSFDVSDLQQVYCQRGGSVDAVLEYMAIKGP